MRLPIWDAPETPTTIFEDGKFWNVPAETGEPKGSELKLEIINSGRKVADEGATSYSNSAFGEK